MKIREIESPPPVGSPEQSPEQSPQQSSQTAQKTSLNSLTITSSQSALKVTNPSVVSNITPQSTHSAQPQQQSVTSNQMPIHSLISNMTGANLQTLQAVQSSPLVQIQTLPFIPINSTQILTQKMNPSVNCSDNTSNISRSNSFSNSNVINLITPTTVAVSYVESNPTPNRTNARLGPEVSPLTANNLISGHFGNAMNFVSKPSNDLTHLLGATVLTFDAQNRPVISVYSPQIALKENSINNNNNNTNFFNNNNKQNDTIDSNSLLNPKMNSSVESSDVSPSMDTSFYSPNDKPMDDTPIETNGDQRWTSNGNCDEMSNHSTNSLLDFSFPSNDSQCK